MDSSRLHSIDDVDALREIILSQSAQLDAERQASATLRQTVETQRRAIVHREARIDALIIEIKRLKRMQFAARSETMDAEQRELFADAIDDALANAEAELEGLRSSIPEPKRPAKQQPRREPLPAHLPRVETRIEPASCTCGDCGAAMQHIGDDISEKLDCEPIKFFVQRTVLPKYACRRCDQMAQAAVPPAIIDRGIAAPGLLAYVLTSKYVDHLPLYRLEAICARGGVTLPTSTLGDWVAACGDRLAPLAAALRRELLAEPVLHADETPIALLDPGAGKTRRAYLFAYRSATEQPIVMFEFCGNRSGKHASRFLDGYSGALMVDDYAGYKALFAGGDVIELACLAHIRRKFFDLHAASKSALAQEALVRIGELYAIETGAREFDAEDRHAHRQQYAAPRLAALKAWLDEQRRRVSQGSGTARAIDYALKRWTALVRYLEDGRYPIDNNPVENAIRPIALGRKNWLFAGSEAAGQRAAAIMTLVATAKANGHDQHRYLKDVLTRLPTTLDRDIGDLLPHRWRPAS